MASGVVGAGTLRHLSEGERAMLGRVKAAVLAVEPTAQIILYGSRARGDAQPDSDWDLLVLLDGTPDRRRAQIVRHQVYGVEVDEESGPVLSTFVYARDNWDSPTWQAMPYRIHVAHEGVPL